ncbi:biotin--[acetyl-CoA-carboxylase] ligase [Labrys monachus]|uniref:biotin--[biotin carboxyl-carrier protein] ligase n=1 Tax=Labrys monachus TaxID=217067 RepID=A0ABU0FGT5_9HYPH|nr:biotin--[acetyl-CoA-carboxylase] ligase [Labrys monachus]MDQ0393817.1 BirA family biotin operon repressor/biotin-[acetyl-CoA-carboxylase] ligase [Labrys monachus]
MKLGTGAQAAGFRHLHLDDVGSTNVEALARGQDRLWVTAGRQSAGKGRRGRAWASPAGNLYASLLLVDPASPQRAADLCFVAALAVSDAIYATAPRAATGLALKWPNDVLVNGAKAAGILIEGAHDGGRFSAVIGCGVNIASHPEGTPYPVTHLAGSDAAVDVVSYFAALSDAFARRLAAWDRGEGFATIRRDWLGRAAGLGRRIVVRLPSGDLDGVFEALDDEGALVLRDDAGRRRPVAAGEVFFPGFVPSGPEW